MPIDNVAYCGVEYGVAEEFEAFVVHGFALGVAAEQALVHQRELVVADVVWVESDDVV